MRILFVLLALGAGCGAPLTVGPPAESESALNCQECGDNYAQEGFPVVCPDAAPNQCAGCNTTLTQFCDSDGDGDVDRGALDGTPAERRGVGMSFCQGPGFLTPRPCDCGDLCMCPAPPAGVQECASDCDCIDDPAGARCNDEDPCFSTCSHRCFNRRPTTFPGEAFSSCENMCPTTFPPPGNPYLGVLPDVCKGPAGMCGSGPALNAPPQNGLDSCGFYLRARSCLTDCSACSSNRLAGYYSICARMRDLANGPGLPTFPSTFPPAYASCTTNPLFTGYTDNMMFCLQAKAAQDAQNCNSCDGWVNGTPAGGVTGGIIGVHTECNAANGFCALAADPAAVPALQCFGASLGYAWGAFGGVQSPIGAVQAVGMCHLMSQLLACWAGNVGLLTAWQNQICTGYFDGCMTQPNFGSGLWPGAQATLCRATCPVLPASLIALAGSVPAGPAGALAFEQQCNAILTSVTNPMGFPLVPGFQSGRDPCITY